MEFHEEIKTINGKKIKRIKSSIIYCLGFISLIIGISLIYNEVYKGAFLVLTIFPFLMLYPLVRFFCGGKDSVIGVVATAILEEVVKNEVSKIARKDKRRY